jgi:hypothetical protein
MIEIDLLAQTIAPSAPAFEPMVAGYLGLLVGHFPGSSAPEKWLKNATISISFDHDADATDSMDQFKCSVQLLDFRDRLHEATRCGRCRPHDPKLERRSRRWPGSRI